MTYPYFSYNPLTCGAIYVGHCIYYGNSSHSRLYNIFSIIILFSRSLVNNCETSFILSIDETDAIVFENSVAKKLDVVLGLNCFW